MTIGEHIEVKPVSGVSLGNPGLPVAVILYEKMSLAFIHDSPAVTRQHALVERLDCLVSITAVEGPGGAEKVAGIIHTGSPDNGSDSLACGRI